MKKSEIPGCPQQSFVITAIFVKQMTVKAKSVSDAQNRAEEQGLLVVEGAELSNWHGYAVEKE